MSNQKMAVMSKSDVVDAQIKAGGDAAALLASSMVFLPSFSTVSVPGREYRLTLI